MLDLGQPRLALLKGAGDVTTHGSPLGKWLLGRGRARRDRSARPDAAGAGALRPSATSEWGPRSLEHRHPGRPWALRSLVSPGLRALQRPESVKDSRIASQRKTATRVRAAGCSIDAALGLHILRSACILCTRVASVAAKKLWPRVNSPHDHASAFVFHSEVLMQGRRLRQSAWHPSRGVLTTWHSHHHPARATQSSRHAASYHASARAPIPTPPGGPPLRRHVTCAATLTSESPVLLLTVPRSTLPPVTPRYQAKKRCKRT